MNIEKYYEVLAGYHNRLTVASRMNERKRMKLFEWAAVWREKNDE